jgi:hypothetical protein
MGATQADGAPRREVPRKSCAGGYPPGLAGLVEGQRRPASIDRRAGDGPRLGFSLPRGGQTRYNGSAHA